MKPELMKPENLNWSLPGAPSGLSIFCDAGSGMLVFNRGDAGKSQAGSRLDIVLSKMRACTVGSNPAVVLHDAIADQAFSFPENLAGKYLRSGKALSDIDVLALTPEVLQHCGGQQAVRKQLVRVWNEANSGFIPAFADVDSSVALFISSWLLEMKKKTELTDENDADPLLTLRPDAKSALRDKLFETIPSVDAKTWSSRRGNSGVNASAALGKYRSAGKLFAVDRGGRFLYPEFQFTEADLPHLVMKDVLAAVPEDARGWPLLSWFDAPNVHLGGSKPREAIAKTPDQVLMAAQRFYGSDE